jgi:hypothetical protein
MRVAYLLVEHTVAFVDVCDVAFVLVEALAREFVSFVLAVKKNRRANVYRN